MSRYTEHRRQNLEEQERHEARVRYEIQQAEAQREYEDRYAPLATASDAHAEWHRNSGVPMGQPGCPQDACHPVDDGYQYEEPEPEAQPTVKCGNKAAHGEEPGYHFTAAGVKECYASTGRFATGAQVSHSAQQSAAADRTLSVEQAAEVMRQRMHEEEAERARQIAEQQEAARREAAKVRYARWREIPVYSRDRGFYALEVDGKVRYFRVERPSKGKWAGRTYVSEQAGDTYFKMEFRHAAPVLDRIADAPAEAALLYGQTIGRCSRCNRTLTDAESRARGIGPDCANKG